MKIRMLKINSHKHLNDLMLDFTYPEGHENAGKTLEKICFIGQSATGKSTILQLIKSSIRSFSDIEILNGEILLTYNWADGDVHINYENGESFIDLNKDGIIINDKKFKRLNVGGSGSVAKLSSQLDIKALFIDANLVSSDNIKIVGADPYSVNIKMQSNPNDFKTEYDKKITEFSHNVSENIWYKLLQKILDYKAKYKTISDRLISEGGYLGDGQTDDVLANWRSEHANPLIDFADKFNPILQKLNLRVDINNTQNAIPIRSTFDNKIIPLNELSTGTQSMLLSFFPLFETDTQNAIVGIDEPERSLYPDIQVDLMSYYKKLAPECQIILATHSPFVAAAFEPEERFILYFDKRGKVCVKRGNSPIGDDPNDILVNDFNIDIHNEFGQKAYQKYLNLKTELKNETDEIEKKRLLKELTQLGDKYNFQ